MSPSDGRQRPLRRYGQLLLLERLAFGTATEVWAAATDGPDEAWSPERLRVLKRLLPGADANIALRVQLERERHIDPLRDAQHDRPGSDGLMRRYLPGRTLQSLLKTSLLESTVIERVADDLQAQLDSLHARGVVHGDIHPRNVVMSPDGASQLIDFGAATPVGALIRSPEGRLRHATFADDAASLARLRERLTEQRVPDGRRPIGLDALLSTLRDEEAMRQKRWSAWLAGEKRSRDATKARSSSRDQANTNG